MSESMEHSYLPVLVAMICITVIYSIALVKNLDGVYLVPIVSAICLLAGVVVPSPLTKNTR